MSLQPKYILLLILVYSSTILFAKAQTGSVGQTRGNADVQAGQGGAGRLVCNFNTDWAFYRGDLKGAEAVQFVDKDWDGVSIPHVMRIEEKYIGDDRVYQGIGWYRRYFTIPAADKGKRICICFEGVQMNCTVFLNGVKLASHTGGYLGFSVDITDQVLFDKDNVLAVRVSNLDDPQTPPGKEQSKLDFNYFGGIYRNVSLVVTNQVFISDPVEANKIAGGGIFITYPIVSRSKAIVRIKTHIINREQKDNKITLTTTLVDKKGIAVAMMTSGAICEMDSGTEIVQTLTVKAPTCWHPDHPYLYHLVSKLYNGHQLVDKIVTPAGIRTISFISSSGKADGFYINGQKLYLRGANRHQAYQNIGDAASNSMQYRDAMQLKKGGFNAVRACHYPQSPAFLDACDELGLLVIECEPGWQFYSQDSTFIKRTYRDIRQMIRRDRNRPSVFLWETSLNESPTPESWMREAVKIAHEEMPGDQLFVADDLNSRSRNNYDVFYKVTNEDGSDPLPSKPSLTREWGDTWIADPAKENGLRASGMYTEKGLINQCILRQNALNGETGEDKGGYWDHARLDANPRIGGYFVWSYNDYTRGSDPVPAFSGVVGINRYEKFGFHQLQAMQSARNPVYEPMVFIASYNNRPDLDTSIIVFSNCDFVTLYRNKRAVGTISRLDNRTTAPFVALKGGSPYYQFSLKNYEAGELAAEGMVGGKVVCGQVVRTPLKPDHLEIEIAERGIKPIADGSDMVPVYIKVCDKYGTVVSNREAFQSYTINLRVTGAGKLIGGNIPGKGISIQQTENGISYGIVRTSRDAGDVWIMASSEGLKSARVKFSTISSRSVMVSDGRHTVWTDENERVYKDTLRREARSDDVPEIKWSVNQVTVNQGTDSDGQVAGTGGTIQQGAGIKGVNISGLEKIIDGNTSTGWVSGSPALPLAFTIDLGKRYDYKGSRIFWGKDSDWYTYEVDGSEDGSVWQVIKLEDKVSGQVYQPAMYSKNRIRYVRILIKEVQPESSRLAIKEIQFFGNPSLP